MPAPVPTGCRIPWHCRWRRCKYCRPACRHERLDGRSARCRELLRLSVGDQNRAASPLCYSTRSDGRCSPCEPSASHQDLRDETPACAHPPSSFPDPCPSLLPVSAPHQAAPMTRPSEPHLPPSNKTSLPNSSCGPLPRDSWPCLLCG